MAERKIRRSLLSDWKYFLIEWYNTNTSLYRIAKYVRTYVVRVVGTSSYSACTVCISLWKTIISKRSEAAATFSSPSNVRLTNVKYKRRARSSETCRKLYETELYVRVVVSNFIQAVLDWKIPNDTKIKVFAWKGCAIPMISNITIY